MKSLKIESKGVPYKGAALAPLIIRYPGRIRAGKIIKSAASSVDFMPTIMRVLNARKSKTRHYIESLPGIDISRELLNNNTIISNNQIRYITDSKNPKFAAAVNQRYKLVLSQLSPPGKIVFSKFIHHDFS